MKALNDTINVPTKPQLTAIPGDKRGIKVRVDNIGVQKLLNFELYRDKW